MKVPRAIALPIVLTICALTLLTAAACFFLSASESHQLEHLSSAANAKFNSLGNTNNFTASEKQADASLDWLTLPALTKLYYRWYGFVFVFPCFNLAVAFFLLRTPECSAILLTWFVCLSVLGMILWSLFSYFAVYVGFMVFNSHW